MKSSKSFIGLIVVSTIFFIYASGVYKNLQSDSALEVVDFSIDGAKTDPASIKSNLDRSPYYGDRLGRQDSNDHTKSDGLKSGYINSNETHSN